jgi:hypothetical protein
MAVACPVDLDTQMLRAEVSKVYARVAGDPASDFHFHRGPVYAAEFLGYDPAELAALPAECTASFAGVANPHAIARLSKARECWISAAVREWISYSLLGESALPERPLVST